MYREKKREREMYLSQMDFAVTHCISEAAVLVISNKKSINIKSGKSDICSCQDFRDMKYYMNDQ